MGLQLHAFCDWDEEAGLMNDFTGRVRLDERRPPKGEQQRWQVLGPETVWH
jgi:hypothetical protein